MNEALLPFAPSKPHTYAGTALWTLSNDRPWLSCIDAPDFLDVFNAVKLRTTQGWALDAAFSPFFDLDACFVRRLFGNFLHLSAVFCVVIPDEHANVVHEWSAAYRATPLHKAAFRIHEIGNEMAAIRNAITGVASHTRVHIALNRTEAPRKELGALEASIAMTYTADMDRPLPT